MFKDPSWSKTDIWTFNNIYAKLINNGYNHNESTTYATAYVWKSKWPQTKYNSVVEKSLDIISKI